MKLQERMLRSIKQRAGNVVIRAELAGMGSASQVTEALKALQDKGTLVRIGTGVYAKTRKSSVTGAVIPAGSLETLAIEALNRILKKSARTMRAVQQIQAVGSGLTSLPAMGGASKEKKHSSTQAATACGEATREIGCNSALFSSRHHCSNSS